LALTYTNAHALNRSKGICAEPLPRKSAPACGIMRPQSGKVGR